MNSIFFLNWEGKTKGLVPLLWPNSLFCRQIACADLLILNKTDLVSPQQQKEVVQIVRRVRSLLLRLYSFLLYLNWYSTLIGLIIVVVNCVTTWLFGYIGRNISVKSTKSCHVWLGSRLPDFFAVPHPDFHAVTPKFFHEPFTRPYVILPLPCYVTYVTNMTMLPLPGISTDAQFVKFWRLYAHLETGVRIFLLLAFSDGLVFILRIQRLFNR